jgi:hypothetical protein
MKTTNNKFLIVLAVAIMLGGLYVYFYKDLNVSAATQTQSDSSLSSSITGNPSLSSLDDKIAEDTAFLSTLVSLTTINIDTSLFSNQSFNALNDNTVKLEPVAAGRQNPFAAIDVTSLDNASVSTSPVITNQPTQVTDKTAILNGAVNSASGVTSTYFEYGPTASLGKTTQSAKQSLVGTFIMNISGLASKTTYFFRAVAKINGSIVNGEIISFNTN